MSDNEEINKYDDTQEDFDRIHSTPYPEDDEEMNYSMGVTLEELATHHAILMHGEPTPEDIKNSYEVLKECLKKIMKK